jgi:putative transposase
LESPGERGVWELPVEVQEIQQAYKFALAPTPRQERMFLSHAGAARFAYNWGITQVAEALDTYQALRAVGIEDPDVGMPDHFKLCKAWTAHKNAVAHDAQQAGTANPLGWVGENFSGTYQAALRDAAGAWKGFFDSRAGRRGGRKVGRPRYKSRHRSSPSFQVHGTTLQVVDTRHVKLPKIGVVRTGEKTRKLLRRVLNGTATLTRGTVTRDSAGRWHIAITVKVQREVRTGPSLRQRTGGAIGVDIGVRNVATLSNGNTIVNPRHLEADLRKLRLAQQALSRCIPGSARRQRARARVAKIHNRVANLRRDALSKAASGLVHNYEKIALEGWDIQRTLQHGSKGLPKHTRTQRNRALASVGLGEFRWMIESRASWYGATAMVADRHQETGRTCSACGMARTKPVPPAEEQFHCLSCGYTADRRLNTARALAVWARSADAPSSGESQNGRGGDVRPAASRRGGRSPTKRQASTSGEPEDQTGTPGP